MYYSTPGFLQGIAPFLLSFPIPTGWTLNYDPHVDMSLEGFWFAFLVQALESSNCYCLVVLVLTAVVWGVETSSQTGLLHLPGCGLLVHPQALKGGMSQISQRQPTCCWRTRHVWPVCVWTGHEDRVRCIITTL